MGLSKEIESRIQRFAVELGELVRRQAIDAVSESFGGGASSRSALATSAVGAVVAKSGRRTRPKGEKRSPDELAQLEKSLFEHVRARAGQRIELIGKSLAISTKELAGPMKKLLARGVVRSEGAKRATRYFAVDGATGSSLTVEAPPRRNRKAGGKKRTGKKR